MPSIYEIRKAGREYCQTEGSEHYKTEGEVEPIDLIIALGYGEGFCMGSIIKYASRFKRTQNLDDLRKVSDYSHIMCGIGLKEKKSLIIGKNVKPEGIGRVQCNNGYCSNSFIKSSIHVIDCKIAVIKSDPNWSGVCVWRMDEEWSESGESKTTTKA